MANPTPSTEVRAEFAPTPLIQWPRAKWWTRDFNPVIGCHKVSPACANCWACEWAKRFKQSFEPHRSSKKTPPNRGVVFAGGLTDLFGDWLTVVESASFIASAASRAKDTDATYIWLTKRVDRMEQAISLVGENSNIDKWLQNHYFGFTAENQEWYDKRFRESCKIPSWANWWISAEPLLGPIDLNLTDRHPITGSLGTLPHPPSWIVVGSESGSNRRPCKMEWVESIVEQCLAANVPVFVKQICLPNGKFTNKIEEFPEHLRIRQVPWAKESQTNKN